MDEKREGFFWLVLIGACALTILYVQRHNLPDRYLEYTNGVEQIREGDRQCKALDAEIDAARQRVENLGSDPLEIEESIRHNKGYVRPGETVIRIQDVSHAGVSHAPNRSQVKPGNEGEPGLH